MAFNGRETSLYLNDLSYLSITSHHTFHVLFPFLFFFPFSFHPSTNPPPPPLPFIKKDPNQLILITGPTPLLPDFSFKKYYFPP